MTLKPSIVWFRLDLRLADNPALAAAMEKGGPVIPVYIRDDEGEGAWIPGGASRWWLHHSLQELAATFAEKGLTLVFRTGAALDVLRKLVAETGADAVYWNRRYEPSIIDRDTAVKQGLTGDGATVKSFNGNLLNEPHTIKNKQGGPFQVFTPYWKTCVAVPVEEPVKLKAGPWTAPSKEVPSESLESWGLLPNIPWAAGFAAVWSPGEAGARTRLKSFLTSKVEAYSEGRDFPSLDKVSGLSPHLHFGEISPRQIWAAARKLSGDTGVFPSSASLQKFLTEVGWREFAHHLLYHFPDTPARPLRREFERFEWSTDEGNKLLQAWQRGRTGYPLVDAGMRELWATGSMHNRVRMVVASFLVKHLRLSWQAGAAWFWDTLVDADLASNTLGWQWSAGCGADAAPYFRIFAPVLQGEKFDGDGHYVRKWVPELSKLPNAWLHKPWEAPLPVLAAAGVVLGKSYPRPVVDHKKARDEALAAYQRLSKRP